MGHAGSPGQVPVSACTAQAAPVTPVTAIPLLAFGGAATRIPLSTLGLMQYFTPVFQFLLGVFYFGETMSTIRWVGFFLIWTSLAVMSVDGLRHARNRADDLEVTEPD